MGPVQHGDFIPQTHLIMI